MMKRSALAAIVMMAVGSAAVLGQTGPASAPAVAQTRQVAPIDPVPASAKPGVEVPVSRIVLFSSGVGYFEHNGSIDGNVNAELRFETAQINDVLKSLVVFDHGGGFVHTITYPANDPVNRTLRSFQVNLSGDPSLAEILKQIRGAAVSIAVGDETITGTVLGVEQKEKAVGLGTGEKVIHTWMVNVLTDAGIRAISLDDVRKLEVLDEKIKKEMKQALEALVQARDQSKKTVTVHFEGAGNRSVGMGYLVETPIWKTTYRLMLPDASSQARAELQAWAIVENQTDNDWHDVSLSLVGGRPISFIELLYQPLYATRPIVQSAITANVIPQTYDNGIRDMLANPQAFGVQVMDQRQADRLSNGIYSNSGGVRMNNNADLAANGANFAQNSIGQQMPSASAAIPEVPLAISDFTQGVAAIAEATKIGEMFHYTVDKVSLPRQQSSMIPIVAEGVKVDRLSIYSEAVTAKYAMRGLRLYNGTGKFLLGGPVTVMDTVKEGHSYAGDAKIEDIPAGQSRLLSYAIDQDVMVQVSRDQGDEALLTGSVVKGVLMLKYQSQQEKEYTLQNKSDNPKTVIIERPVVDGYELKEPAKPQEKTSRVYRFEVTLAAKETKKVPVVLEKTRLQEMAIVSMKDDPMMFYVQQNVIPEKVRAVLATVAAKRGALADLERRRVSREQDRTQTLQEQQNVRENIKVLPVQSKSQEEAIRDLAVKDAELKAANKDIVELKAAITAAQGDLAKYLESTSVE